MALQKSVANSLQLQERDLALLQGLFESRVMTQKHVAELYFENKGPYATKRLQQIKAAGLCRERKRRRNERAILSLTNKGFLLLRNEGRLSSYPYMLLGKNSFEARTNVSEFTLRHELEIMDVKAAFHTAIAKTKQLSISEFITWPILCQFEATHSSYGNPTIVKPDGFIQIHEDEEGTKGSSYDFFLELDRSNEKLDILISRSLCYLDYYKSGGFALKNRGTRANFKDFPFRVLIVLKTAERRNNLAERLFQNIPPILRQVWLTTLAEVTSDPLAEIWIQPEDYRNAVKGSRFYRERPNSRFEYSRDVERDSFVEHNVPRLRLLGE
jgi:hypothetical protein